MISIKLSAKDLKTIEQAESEEQLRGLRALLVCRIQEGKETREKGKNPNDPWAGKDKYLWREAREDLKAVLGDKLIVPPFPLSSWYGNINKAMQEQGMDSEYVTNLAHYVKDNLNAPYSMEFILRQHARILGGAWSKQSPISATKTNWLNDTLPD